MIEDIGLEPKVHIYDPSEITDDGLEWLELENIPTEVYNPLENYAPGLEPLEPTEEVMSILTNADYLHFACKHILNIELLPYQLVILDTLWRKRLPMLIASRGGGKSFILAVYGLLRMVFHPGCKVVICGAAFRQARQVFDYMSEIWDKAPILRDISGRSKETGPRREVDRCQFTIGTSKCFAIPLGDGTKIRGLRANYILADEFASIPEEIFNLVVQGFGVVSASPVDKVKESAMIKKLKKLGQWSDDMEKVRQSQGGGNQIVYSGTAYYSFNHFYRYFQKWHQIIRSKGDMSKLSDIFTEGELANEGFNWHDYAILRIPYDKIPEGMLDPGIVAQARATLHHSQFMMEYGATFAADSDGFYKRSIIESATTNKPILVPSGEYIQFSASRRGDKKKSHVIAVDPAADLDNAAIVILELNEDHRKVVYCWTTNRKKYGALKREMAKSGVHLQDDYYRYIAKKIRSLMRDFNTERIVMDKHGGGTAIAEALESADTYGEHENPIYQLINPEEPKESDMKKGIHILELLAPTQDLNSDANHGMLKDLQDKVLLFPMFDTVEMERAIQLDKVNGVQYDTYEDLVQDIEELKTEMTTIVLTQSSILGKDTFDTPQIKTAADKKGRLRKDRYSALLYANYYARMKDRQEPTIIQYNPIGGTKDSSQGIAPKHTGMYYGPGMSKFGQTPWNYSPPFTCVIKRT